MLDRTLDAVVSLPGVDAALVAIGEQSGAAVTRAEGLSEDEIERTLLQMPTHPDLRALEVVYRYRLDDVDEPQRSSPAPGSRSRSAPRERRSARSPRSGGRAPSGFSDATAGALETLARRAGPAIWNAMRFVEARELAELDSLTGLHNRRLFYEFLSREIARAHRYERYVSVIVFDLDDFKRINDRIGHLEGDGGARSRWQIGCAASFERRTSPAASAATSSPSSSRSRAATTPSSSPTGSRSRSAG